MRMHISEIAEKIAICANCFFMCKDMCTVYAQTKVDSLSPSMHEYLLWLILEGREKYSEEVAKTIYRTCCSCLLCQSSCATRQDVPEKVRAARTDIADLDLTPRPVKDLDTSTRESHNPFREPHEKRFREITQTSHQKQSAKTLYFVGCTAAYHQPEIANAVITILEKAGADFALMKSEEWCCGLPLFELGLRETALSLAQHNSQFIRNAGYNAVVTSCPECCYMFRNVYPTLGFPLDAEIYHISEYARLLLENGRLTPRKRLLGRVTYHDPCYLGRHCRVYEDPRTVIKQIADSFVEMRWNRDKAYCGGSGVGYSILYPETASKIASRVLEESEKVGAEILITACPTCKSRFSQHQHPENLRVYDIAEALMHAL